MTLGMHHTMQDTPLAGQTDPTPTVAEPGSPADTGQPPAGTRGRTGAAVVREIVQTLLLAAILFFGVRAFVLPFEVDGMSMTPNLADHERVLVNRQAFQQFDVNRVLNWIPGVDRDGTWNFSPFGELERGDVVVLEPPVTHDQPFIKRVIGLPGDRISFADGYVLVNGERLDEQYIPDKITECDRRNAIVDGPTCDVTVPDGSVYVMGDNRTRGGSEDSRYFGVVSIDDLVGEAFFSNWPWDRIGPIRHGDYGDQE